MKAFVFLALLSSAYAARDFKLQCEVKSDSGNCDLELQRWWYNSDAQRCEEFTYSGCGGNANLYKTKEACERTCIYRNETGLSQEDSEVDLPEGVLHEVCLRPPHRGPCLGNLRKFYFNYSEGGCKPFVYGGCGSNGNNFESELLCMNTCYKSVYP